MDGVFVEYLDGRLDAAKEFARRAGALTLNWYRDGGLQVESKSDQSPVTIADRSAEELLRELIAAAFPQDAIVGEEFGERSGTSGFRWILDPIDGTKSFICGVPLFGTMVAVDRVTESGLSEPLVGVLDFPALGEGIFAGQGQGAWCYDAHSSALRPARVSGQTQLSECVVLTSDHQTFAKRSAADAWERLTSQTRYSRTWGDAYGYYLVATGRAQVMVDPILNIWDAAAVLPIILEAGGEFTDWQGRRRVDSGDAIATNRWVHAAVVECLLAQQ